MCCQIKLKFQSQCTTEYYQRPCIWFWPRDIAPVIGIRGISCFIRDAYTLLHTLGSRKINAKIPKNREKKSIRD